MDLHLANEKMSPFKTVYLREKPDLDETPFRWNTSCKAVPSLSANLPGSEHAGSSQGHVDTMQVILRQLNDPHL